MAEIRAVLAADTAGIRPGDLDGFLTGIGSMPTMLPPSAWLTQIIGELEFRSGEEATRIAGLILRHYNQIIGQLNNERAKLSCTSLSDDELADWCEGYMLAARMDSVWVNEPRAYAVLLPVTMLARSHDRENWTDGCGDKLEDTAQYLADFRRQVPKVVREVNEYWTNFRRNSQSAAPPEVSLKVGRNNPCPCGSGKKFKRCCG